MVTALRPWVQYAVVVRAYNAHGSGPISPPVVVRTLEDGRCLGRLVPRMPQGGTRERRLTQLLPPTVPSAPPVGVECSGGAGGSSLHVRWAPPPPAAHNGLLQGFRLTLTRLDDSTGTRASTGACAKAYICTHIVCVCIYYIYLYIPVSLPLSTFRES